MEKLNKLLNEEIEICKKTEENLILLKELTKKINQMELNLKLFSEIADYSKEHNNIVEEQFNFLKKIGKEVFKINDDLSIEELEHKLCSVENIKEIAKNTDNATIKFKFLMDKPTFIRLLTATKHAIDDIIKSKSG